MAKKTINKKKVFTVGGIILGLLTIAGAGYALYSGSHIDAEAVAESVEKGLSNASDNADFMEA